MHESEKWKGSRSVVSDSSNTRDCSPPGFSGHGIFQAKVLECGAIAFSEGTPYKYLNFKLDFKGNKPKEFLQITFNTVVLHQTSLF